MADHEDLWKRIGLTPGKAVLIGVLAAALMGVLYTQYWPDGAEEELAKLESTTIESPPPPLHPPGKAVAATPPAANVTAPASDGRDKMPPLLEPVQWKSPDVSTVVAYDPFALPPEFPQPSRLGGQGLTSDGIIAADAASRASQLADAVARLQTELETLRQRGVSVIVKQHDQYVAMIGDRTVQVGDEINGFTVTAIEADGVRVEKKVTE